jgi:hypothetical protein
MSRSSHQEPEINLCAEPVACKLVGAGLRPVPTTVWFKVANIQETVLTLHFKL